eukprot:5461546-Pyramimonas_sp.AAC.2
MDHRMVMVQIPLDYVAYYQASATAKKPSDDSVSLGASRLQHGNGPCRLLQPRGAGAVPRRYENESPMETYFFHIVAFCRVRCVRTEADRILHNSGRRGELRV